MKNPQLNFLTKEVSAYGGDLLKTRKGRKHGRPIDTRNTMHLVLRSTKAVGDWSFLRPKNKKRIIEILKKFTAKYGIKIISFANVGNHLHLHIKLSNRYTYAPFIRAVTGAIMMVVTGINRWKPSKIKERFWNCRPFTCVVKSLRAFLNLRNYIRTNELEALGFPRAVARELVKRSRGDKRSTVSERNTVQTLKARRQRSSSVRTLMAYR